MILHVLGGGPAQLGLIRRAKELGFQVAVSDRNPEAPGLKEADHVSPASSFDRKAVLKDAADIGSDFLITSGTDQPVLTAAEVSAELNLPYFLSPRQARTVTNKKDMKKAFHSAGIPTMDFTFLKEDFSDSELEHLTFPPCYQTPGQSGAAGGAEGGDPR